MVTRFKDWYGFREPEFKKYDSWFHEHLTAARAHLNDAYWEGDTGLVWSTTTASSGTRIQHNYTASSAVQSYLNAVRFDLVSDTDYVFYSDDGTTELLVIHRDDDTVRVKNGTVGSPSIIFENTEQDTGFYRHSADTIGVASAGSLAARFNYTGGNGWIYTDVISLSNEIQAADSTAGDPSYSFTNAGNAGLGYDGSDVFISAASTNRIIINGSHTYIRGGNTSTGRVYAQQSDGTDIVSFDYTGTQRRMIVPNARFDVAAETGATLDFRFSNLPTTTNAANAYVTSATGQLNRSTSLRQYKWAIGPIESSHIDIMDLKPRQFKWQPNVSGHDYRPWSLGFVVEELEEVSPALVNLEKNPDTGEIHGSGIDERALLAVIVDEIQKIKKQLKEKNV